MPRFCAAAGFDWWVHLGERFGDLVWVRGRAGGHDRYGQGRPNARTVALAGRGEPVRGATPFPDLPLPEKVLAGWVRIGGELVTVVSYHAPTGAQHGLLKPAQAVRVAEWLASLDGPVVFGGDFNTPLVDHPDFVQTHYWTGAGGLGGSLGDDVLVGDRVVHGLREALRSHLAGRPEEMTAIRAVRPQGPLAVSYRTGDQDEQRFRFDQVWLSEHFRVTDVRYLYDEAIEAGTDHALVLVDAVLTSGEGSDG